MDYWEGTVGRRRMLLGPLAMACAAGAAALGGCGQRAEQSGGSAGQPAAQEAAQLRLLHNWGPTQAHSGALADLVQEYTTAHPGISIALDYNPGGDPFVAKLRALLAAGTPPDLATLLQDYLPSMAPALAPLEKVIGQRDFNKGDVFDGPLSAATFQGTIIGAPYISTVQAMGVNEEAFQAAGQMVPKEGWTWNDLVEGARRVTTDDRFGVQAPLTMPEWLPYLWQAGGEVLDGSGKKAVFNQPPGRDALQLMVDLVNRYRVAPPPDVTSDFVQGKVAMTNAWAGSLSMWTTKIQSFSWTTLPLPKWQRSATVLSGHAMTVLKDAQSQPPAGRFAQWFTSAPQLARFNSRTFTLPPRKSGQSQPAWMQFVQAQPRLKAYADSLTVSRATPVHLKWQEMSVVIADAIVKAVKQEVSAQTALDDAARQVDALAPQG